MLPEIIASDLCPPGKAYVINRDAFGIEGGKLVVVSDDHTKLRIEDAVERYAAMLHQFAVLMNLGGGSCHTEASE